MPKFSATYRSIKSTGQQIISVTQRANARDWSQHPLPHTKNWPIIWDCHTYIASANNTITWSIVQDRALIKRKTAKTSSRLNFLPPSAAVTNNMITQIVYQYLLTKRSSEWRFLQWKDSKIAKKEYSMNVGDSPSRFFAWFSTSVSQWVSLLALFYSRFSFYGFPSYRKQAINATTVLLQFSHKHLRSVQTKCFLNCSKDFSSLSLTFFETAVTRMDTPKYGETLKFMNIKYQRS